MAMTLEKLVDALSGAERFAIESDFDFDESITRLAAATKRPLFGNYRPAILSLKLSIVVGNVSQQDVLLWVERISIRNNLRPVFIGNFHMIESRVILIGKFTMHKLTSSGLVGWACIMACWTAAVLWQLVKNPSDRLYWILLAGAPVAFLFVVGMTRFFKWLSSDDIPVMMLTIQSALRKSTSVTPRT